MRDKGKGGLPEDKRESVSWVQKAAILGNATAMSFLAIMYSHGMSGLPVDRELSLEWKRKAALYGNKNAMVSTAQDFLKEKTARSDVQALALFRRAVSQGDARAKMYLGTMYEDGRGGLLKDEIQAVYWYRESAIQGCMSAMHRLSIAYSNGHGVTKDRKEAAKWQRFCIETERALIKQLFPLALFPSR
jgi:hypothetical protein